jgi:hypothetical protein
VPVVVAAAVAQVDAAHEGDVGVRAARVAQQHQLLVLAARAADPLVQQDLAAGAVDHRAEVEVLRLVEVELARVGAP